MKNEEVPLFGFRNESHYNNRGLFCDPHIIANNKEKRFRKPAVANHNSSQTVKPLRYYNIRTRTIASPSQLPNLTQSQKFYDRNCFYIPFAIDINRKLFATNPSSQRFGESTQKSIGFRNKVHCKPLAAFWKSQQLCVRSYIENHENFLGFLECR